MIHNLVISGGRTKTLAAVGALKYLEEQGMLDDVTRAVGCSAGAIVCLMLVLGYLPSEMEDSVNALLLERGRHHLNLDAMLSILDEYGLDRGENLTAFVEDVVHGKMGCRDATFMELAKRTGKSLVVCVANVTEQRTEYLDVNSQPDMSVVLAIRMSTSLPILFTPIAYRGCLYADGALYESLPIGFIDRECKDPLRDTLAINTVTKTSVPVPLETVGFASYVSYLLTSIHDRACEPRRVSPKIKIVCIEFEEGEDGAVLDVAVERDGELVAFPLDRDMLRRYVLKGYDAMQRHSLSRTERVPR
jgi:predicted acylesterase/phospholipase RssA